MLVCRADTIAEGLKSANRHLLIKLIDWPLHFVHYRKLDHKTLSDPVVPNGIEGSEKSPSDAADFIRAGANSPSECNTSPLHSCSTESIIDKVPVCISHRIGGSGAQPLTKHVMKASLLTLSHPTFSLSQVQETETFQLAPTTRNRDLGVPTGLLLPVYTGGSRVVPKYVAHKDLGFKIASTGMQCSVCVMSAKIVIANILI